MSVQLRYIPEHRVLLCTTCQYCVPKPALARHLKDIHHLSKSERNHHINKASALGHLEPEDVVYPEPGRAAIPGIPVDNGFACGAPGCAHLCVTYKRMTSHWRENHSRMKGPLCRRVKLQTFFKGSSLRYFIVASGHGHSQALTSRKQAAAAPNPRAPKRSPASNPNQTLEEWYLLQHFFSDANWRLQPCKSSRNSWKDQILQVSSNFDLLRWAMLSVTASHIAFEYPALRQHYGAEAMRYQSMAIKNLLSGAVEIKKENFFAIFNFSRFMTVACLASARLGNLTSELKDAKREPILPEWVSIQLSGRALVWRFRGQGRIVDAMHGPFKDLRAADAMAEENMPNNPLDRILEDIELALRAETAMPVHPACLEAFRTLRRLWALPFSNNAVGFRDVTLMWIVRVPARYLELVSDEDPMALIVLAHFCAMWSLAENQFWYMQGHADRWLAIVQSRLDSRWRSWMLWPTSIVLTFSRDTAQLQISES